MRITPGQVIAHYEIVEKLGEGGMGLVYRAVDTRLDRTVALKFLPPGSSRDEAAKQRFVREAKAASAQREVGPVRGVPADVRRRAAGHQRDDVAGRPATTRRAGGGDANGMGAYHRPLLYERLGRLADEQDDSAQALTYFERLLNLWRDCDPALAARRDTVAARRDALVTG